MSILMVKSPNGDLRRVELSKNQPLTIGSHSISDIQINDPGIELMEARISWGKQDFEVTAANPKGVTLNNETVMAADLKPGDVLQLGATELLFTTPELLEKPPEDEDDSETLGSTYEEETDLGLAQIAEENHSFQRLRESPHNRKGESGSSASSSPDRESPSASGMSKGSDSATEAPLGHTEGEDEWEVIGDDDTKQTPLITKKPSFKQPPAQAASSVGKIRETLSASRQRPGEQEFFRSPLVMGLLIGSFFLLAGAIILWAIIGQENADRYLKSAREQADQRKFQQAIKAYETYLIEFPRDPDHDTALRELSVTKVRSKIDLGVPDWEAGLKELEQLIERHQDEPDFDRLHNQISDFSEQIAIGACEQAGREGKESFFEISEAAVRLVELYTSDEDRREKILSEVQTARRTAEARILKESVFSAALAGMESALENARPFELFDARSELLQRYPAAEDDRRVTQLTDNVLELLQAQVRQQPEEIAALELPDGENPPAITLTATSPVDFPPSGRPVYVHGADCLYGLDTVTGQPMWRHVVGWDLPFFPEEVELETPGLLVYSDRSDELQLLARTSGQLIWRQSLPDTPVGPPLVDGIQAFLATEGGQLIQIDLSTGKILGGLSFPQPLATRPLLLPESHQALLVGERELAYLVELNPARIADVLHFGHAPGSIVSDPIRMGPLVLVAENDRGDSARLRVFDTRLEDSELVQIDDKRLPGQVIDSPVIRGNQLLVPSTPERVTAFRVTAELDQPVSTGAGQSALTEVSDFQVPEPRLTSTWLSAGPDGQVWMVSSGLRRMHLTTESLDASSDVAAVGIATQPVQMLGDRLYVVRRPEYGTVVRCSRINRNDFSGAWRTILGDRILQAAVNSTGELITLHDSGSIFRLQNFLSYEQTFALKPNAVVDLPDSMQSERFTATLSDGRFAITWGGVEPKLCVVRSTGQIERETGLPDEPQAAPVDLEAGLVAALPGRLHLVAQGRDAVNDFLLPVVDGENAKWHSLTRLDATHLLCVDDAGIVRRIEFRREPLHLAEAGKLELDSLPAFPPLLTAPGRLLIATEDRQLLSVAADSLQIASTRDLGALPDAAWKSETSVFLQLQNDQLACLNCDEELTERWRVELGKQMVAGAPLEQGGEVFVPVAPEGVWILEKESGELLRKVATPGTCSGDPLLIEGQVVIPLADGSLFVLRDPVEEGKRL